MASRISDMAAPAVRLAKRLNLTIEGGKNKKDATKTVSSRCSEGRRPVEQQLDKNPRKCLWVMPASMGYPDSYEGDSVPAHRAKNAKIP